MSSFEWENGIMDLLVSMCVFEHLFKLPLLALQCLLWFNTLFFLLLPRGFYFPNFLFPTIEVKLGHVANQMTECTCSSPGVVYLVPDLEPDTSYLMRVASRNNAGVSEYSPPLSVKTLKESNAATVTASGACAYQPNAGMALLSLLSMAIAAFAQRCLWECSA